MRPIVNGSDGGFIRVLEAVTRGPPPINGHDFFRAARTIIRGVSASGRARDIFEERQIARGRETDAAERPRSDGDVRLVPKADVWLFSGHDLLHLAVARLPRRLLARLRRLVQETVDLRVVVVAAVESERRHL